MLKPGIPKPLGTIIFVKRNNVNVLLYCGSILVTASLLEVIEVVLFQARKNSQSVQNFALKIINKNCPELKAFFEGPRRDKRLNLTLVVMVIPLVDGKLQLGDGFYAITQEMSATGVGLVLDKQIALDEVILGFRLEDDMNFVHASAKHLSPMGGGFYHLGLEMTKVIPISEYPQLKTLKI